MIEFKKICYVIKHFIIVNILLIFTFISGIVLSVLNYSASKSGLDEYWISPTLSLIPVFYSFLFIYSLFKKMYLKSTFFCILLIYFISIFIYIYTPNGLIKDFEQVFNFKKSEYQHDGF